MSARSGKPTAIDEAKIVRDLEALRAAAMEAGAFAPALRSIELFGRHIGMWRSEAGDRQPTLAELIAEAGRDADEQREDGRDGR